MILSRQPPKSVSGRPAPRVKNPIPSEGGTLIVSIEETHSPAQAGGGPARSPKARMLAELQRKTKLGALEPSNEVEGLKLVVRWQPTRCALGIVLPPSELVLPDSELSIVSSIIYAQMPSQLTGVFENADKLDFEVLLRRVIETHTKTILSAFRSQLQHSPTRTAFSHPEAVSLIISSASNTQHIFSYL